MQETFDRISKWYEKFKADCWKRWYLFPFAVLVAVLENRIMDLLNQLVDKVPFSQIGSAIASIGSLHVVNRSVAALVFVVGILLVHSYWETRPSKHKERERPTEGDLEAERAVASAKKAISDAMPPKLGSETARSQATPITAKALSDAMLYPKATLQSVAEDSELLILNAPAPARVQLRFQKRGGDWLWRIHNRELREIGPCQLMMRQQHSFDTELGKYRESVQFSYNLGNIQRLAAGDMSDQRYFTRLDGAELEIGDTKLTRLPWPNGDESEIRQWMIELDFSGLTSLPSYAIWKIDLVIKWNTKTLTLTLVQYSSGLTAVS